MEKNKIIFDLIHGYIEICPNTEKIVNTESFQRLKYINQLTSQHLFPSANHTRFEHSLGVMKLSLDFFNKIKNQLREILQKKDKIPNFSEKLHSKLESLKIHLQFAALLHDIGHAPLSHVGEKLYNKADIDKQISLKCKKHKIKYEGAIFKASSPHELMSCYVILENFYDKLASLKLDFEFIFRIITGAIYSEPENWDKNIIISIVNSKTIDADKLDYLMRDNLMTGKVGPEIDITRLLESLIITDDNQIALQQMCLSTLQKIIDCRDSLYMWVCNHHTVVYTDYLYYNFFKHIIRLKEENIDNPEAIEFEELFSCDAIAKKNVTDNEAMFYLKRAKNLSKENKTSKYTKKIVDQLVDRKFLKPSWKTLYDFTEFIKKFDDKKRREIIDFFDGTKNKNEKLQEKTISKIVHHLINETNSSLGDIFLIVRANKFYFNEDSEFYIYKKTNNIHLSSLLPPRDYKSLYNGIAFYLYSSETKIDLVKETFFKLMKNNNIQSFE